jgi:hypothetical protein
MACCDADQLKGELFFRWPSIGVPEIVEALKHLHALGRIKFFRGSDETFCQILSWNRHQKVHKPSAFRYRNHYEDFRETVPECCGTSEAPEQDPPPLRLPDSETPSLPDSQLQGSASRRAEADSHTNNNGPTFSDLMALVREHLYVPDGKPAAEWKESRDGSILKQLLKRHGAGDLACAIEGLAILRDFPGHYADSVDWPHWPKPGNKLDLRAIYNNKSGVLPMFTLATQAFWKRANTRPSDEQ